MTHHQRGKPTPEQAIIGKLSDAAFRFTDESDWSGSPRPEQPFGDSYRSLVDTLVATKIRAYHDSTRRDAARHDFRCSIRQFEREVGAIRELVRQSAGNLRESITALKISVAIPHPIDIDQLINLAKKQLGLNTDERTAPCDGLAVAVMAKSSAIMQHTEAARSSLQKVIEGCTDLRRRGERVLLSGQKLREDISDLQKEIEYLEKRGSQVLPRRQARLKKLIAAEEQIKKDESATISELTPEAEALVMVWREACQRIGEAFQSTDSNDEKLAELNTAHFHGREGSISPEYLMTLNLSIRGSLVCKLLLVSLSEDGRSIFPAKAIQTIERDVEKFDPAASFNLCGEKARALKLIRALLQTVFPQGYSIPHTARIVQAHWNAETPAGGQFDFAKRLVADCLDEIIRESDRVEAERLIFTFGEKPIPLPQFKNS